MVKRSLIQKLGRKALLFLVGAMASVSACGGDKPSPVEPPPTNQSPVSSFVVQPKEGYAPLTTNFNGSSSRDPDGTISKFIWTFGDGSADSTSGANVQHMYSTPGNYSPGLTVVDNKEARGTSLDQIISKDGSPSINVPDFSFNEDEQYNLDLNGKIASPVYGTSGLKVTVASPQLNVILNGYVTTIANKTKDWNGSTYIDLTVEDQDGRKTAKRVNVTESPMTDIKGYLEDVLTGAKISGVPINYQSVAKDTSDANGNFDFQAPISNDTLKINSNQRYNVKIPINANGQDVNLSNVQMINRYTDPITSEDLLTFMKSYLTFGKWDLPIKAFIDNNPPSPEYREAVRQGLMNRQDALNQCLPEEKKVDLFQIVNSEPSVGLSLDYTSSGGPEYSPTQAFVKGVIKMNPSQVGDARIRAIAHEVGHAFGWSHTPYPNQNIYHTYPVLTSSFEGCTDATNIRLKKGATGLYSK